MGPMQFIPATWEEVGVDADGDGERNPDNIFDAATGAGVYLCSGDTDLRDPDQFATALHYYNPSDEYVALVSRLANAYRMGTDATGLGPGGYRDRYDSGGPTTATEMATQYGYRRARWPGGSYRSRFGRPTPGGGFDYLDPYTDLEVELPPFGLPRRRPTRRPTGLGDPAAAALERAAAPAASRRAPAQAPGGRARPVAAGPPTTPFPGLERPPTPRGGPGAAHARPPRGPPHPADHHPGTSPTRRPPPRHRRRHPAPPGDHAPHHRRPADDHARPPRRPRPTTHPATTPPTTGAPPAPARRRPRSTTPQPNRREQDAGRRPDNQIDRSKIPVDNPATQVDESKIPVDNPTTQVDESKTPLDDPDHPGRREQDPRSTTPHHRCR